MLGIAIQNDAFDDGDAALDQRKKMWIQTICPFVDITFQIRQGTLGL